ncbi:GNAT family N-acetyltransferase [candidate division KSB1 bacterium]
MSDYNIITVDSNNVDEFDFFCVKNKKHPGYISKLSWLKQRFKEGMRIKLIQTAEGKHAGFLEYTPGEYTWRVVNAPDYLVIHCIWVNSNKFPYKGMTPALLKNCLKDAESSGLAGAAVITSDGSWIASKEVFVKNGFKQVDKAEPGFQLLIKQQKKSSLPAFPTNWSERLNKFNGLQLIYTNQCPYIAKAVKELPPVAKKYGISLNLVELNDPGEVRKTMPSPYGMICLVYNGQLLSDHPISSTRFRNILVKDLKLEI